MANGSSSIFTPDPPPAGVDQVLSEWIIRQLLRISSSTSLVTEKIIVQDSGNSQLEQDLNAHIQNQTNPHVTTHLLLPDKGTNDHAAIDSHIQSQTNPHNTVHSLLADVSSNLTHPDIDAELTRLEQDKLDTADAVQVFSFVAYASAKCPLNTTFADLGATWQDLDIFTTQSITPKGITLNLVDGRFTVLNEGIYNLSITGSMEHNSDNSGRVFYIGLYNYTDSVAVGSGLIIGSGRNVFSTTISISFLLDVDSSLVNKELGFQIGDGDTYTSVNFQTAAYSINAEGEWRGTIP